MKRMLIILLIAMFATVSSSAQLSDEDRLVAISLSITELTDNLAQHPNYQWAVWQAEDEDTIWEIEFYVETADDYVWLGWALIDLSNDEILEFYVPRLLTPEEQERLEPLAIELAMSDLEVQAVVTDPNQWEVFSQYIDDLWVVAFFNGFDEWVVEIYMDADTQEMAIETVYNANQLTDEEADAFARDSAVALAYETPEIDNALAGYDDWQTFIQPMESDVFTVEFVSSDQQLFCAVVNISTNESKPC